MTDLWADLDAASREPGPTMTITKAQYAALHDAARQPAPEAALREAVEAWAELRIAHGRGEDLGPIFDRHAEVASERVRAALAAAPTPDPAAPDLRSSAAWLVQRWDGNRTVQPDALRADIAVLRSALRGATPGLGGKPRG